MERQETRERMKPVSESMRGWGEALGRELEGWPEVTLKRAFGMTLVYRKEVLFVALPGTQALHEQDAIMVKFVREPASLAARIRAEERFAGGDPSRMPGREGRKWRFFLMREDADVHCAIDWMAEAYRLAGKGRK